MKIILSSIFALFSIGVFGQGVVSNSCDQAQNICNSVPVPFPLSTGVSPNPTVPPAGSFSNPSSNPAGMNSGCLLAGELNPNWFVLNVTSTGQLEFDIGAAGGSGYFDWELWPYDPVTGCTDILNNLVAPAACNWNASAQGFTGMSSGGPPAGGLAGNFQPSIPVVAGTAYILMFSNYSYQVGNVALTFPPSGASIGCSGGTPDQTICLGDVATVDIAVSPGWIAATANWLVTNNVSNTTGMTGVLVDPIVTTDYEVEIWDQGVQVDTVMFTITVEVPPSPDAGPDQTICLGTPIQLDGTQSDILNTLIWQSDVSAVIPAPTVNYVPSFMIEDPLVSVNQVGTYLFILREGNAICGNIYDTVQIIVDDLSITASAVAPSCIGFADGQVHITSADAVQYSFDGGITWVTDSFNIVMTASNYTVCGRSALGCEKCVTVDVIDPAAVVASINNDSTICQNGTAFLNADATGGTSYLYHWDHTASTADIQLDYPINSTTYIVYAENQNGCVSVPVSIDITVLPPLTGTITDWDTVCPTYLTDISADVMGGLGTPYEFVWSSGPTQNGPNFHTITVEPGVTTTYTVTITDQCESTPLVMITNVRVAPLPVPTYTVLDPEQCEPAVFHIVNTTDPTMSQYNYWLVDGNQQFINQDTITTDSLWAGLYDMQMIITSYEGCVDSLTFLEALNVKPKPVADFKHSPNPVLMFNTDVLFTNYSWQGYSYQWSFEGGYPSTSTSTDVNVQFPDGVTGGYDIQLITTSELGCVDTMQYELIVFPEVLIYAPNSFTPDGDEFNQGWQVFMEGIDIYDFDLQIFNRWGQVIWESHDISVPWDGTFNGKIVQAGAYQWIIRATDLLNDNKYVYDGHVNLLK
ncbi:MAG: gliding motility-associated C-terminal domain-containing protein [Crocinitomicaceae bacterium]|nr:gliding motility-associated C-terminal domain-containing protein [Crocinitomicaceae bacterium]